MGVLMRVVETESASRGTDVNHAHVSRHADLRSTSGLRYELEGYSKIEMRRARPDLLGCLYWRFVPRMR